METRDYTYKGWAEAFTIFFKYDPKEMGSVSCEHDIIYAGPSPEQVSDEDKKRLEELGWHPKDEFECFYQFV